MDADDGDVRWRYRAGGAVKGGLALADGKLYFGAYGGSVYAIRQSNGSQVWRASSSGGAFGLGAGNFYSTPAVAYGRVYIGSTNGRMYSFAASSGKLAWSKSTGGYVYASPAVAQVPGGRRSSTRAPTAAASTRSTRAAARSAGRAAATAASPAARP